MCLGFRTEGFTTIVTVENSGGQKAKLALGISETSSTLHRINIVPVCQPFSPQASSNMSTVEVERLVLAPRRKIFTGLSMPKSKACRKLVFEPSPNQNDREAEDAASEETSDNYLQEHRERQMQRWGFDFGAGRPLPNGRLNWEAESEERVPAFYRESCLRSPPRRNHRVRRNIMSARTSESAEHHHSADNGTLAVGQVHGSRVSASARSETETASVAVCTSSVHREELTSKDINHGCNSVETSNNGISSRPSTSQASITQSHIHGMYNKICSNRPYLLNPCYIPPSFSISLTLSSTTFFFYIASIS